MEVDLGRALQAVFNAEHVPQAVISKVMQGQAPKVPLAQRAQKALEHYNKAMGDLKRGDWAGYGDQLKQLKEILQEMSKEP